MLTPRGERQMARFQIAVVYMSCVGSTQSNQVQSWDLAHQLVFVNMEGFTVQSVVCVQEYRALQKSCMVELLMLLQTYTELENVQVKYSASVAHFFLALAFVSEVESWSELRCQMLLTVSPFKPVSFPLPWQGRLVSKSSQGSFSRPEECQRMWHVA